MKTGGSMCTTPVYRKCTLGSLCAAISLPHFSSIKLEYTSLSDFLRFDTMNVQSFSSLLGLFLLFLRAVKPYVRLRSAKAESGRHPSILVCSVYNFYPKQIRVTWLRNGEKATSNVKSTDELANGNWLYHVHSYLEYTPRLGETITCMVEHASFKHPKLYDWEPLSESERTKITAGAAGMLLGIVVLLAGGIYYKRNTTGRVLVPLS
ncbi:SLA class II histocompatibility antigen, DQ haplotype C beta chain-like isoform X2 [Paralichthys olivaceus]|uniref:SLA class II histocompatibility antigen, DQ haplotype C beta chain-like isoform X2 n=1 Tax=Paralichthys olivaceus TaxID=8255 RepID=UPI00374FEFFA